MSGLEIITNRVPRPTLNWGELTDREKKEFDYLDTDEKQWGATFIRYREWVYNLGDIMRVDKYSPFYPGWHGYKSDTFFSGVLFKFTDDNESVICATYYSF